METEMFRSLSRRRSKTYNRRHCDAVFSSWTPRAQAPRTRAPPRRGIAGPRVSASAMSEPAAALSDWIEVDWTGVPSGPRDVEPRVYAPCPSSSDPQPARARTASTRGRTPRVAAPAVRMVVKPLPSTMPRGGVRTSRHALRTSIESRMRRCGRPVCAFAALLSPLWISYPSSMPNHLYARRLLPTAQLRGAHHHHHHTSLASAKTHSDSDIGADHSPYQRRMQIETVPQRLLRASVPSPLSTTSPRRQPISLLGGLELMRARLPHFSHTSRSCAATARSPPTSRARMYPARAGAGWRSPRYRIAGVVHWRAVPPSISCLDRMDAQPLQELDLTGVESEDSVDSVLVPLIYREYADTSVPPGMHTGISSRARAGSAQSPWHPAMSVAVDGGLYAGERRHIASPHTPRPRHSTHTRM
ncbi:hypothetical protein B0H14DRAFT_1454983 [Mycena olivaceomarginata]|nr:hypothetical protein B0H14DRAFT_1454983 [Mycena olivaceomarginata]